MRGRPFGSTCMRNYVPRGPPAACIQFLRGAHLPSPGSYRLGTPDVGDFGAYWFTICYDLLSCSPPFLETFTSGLPTALSPSPLPDMTTVATGQFPPAGFTPAGSTTSVAAQLPPPHLTPSPQSRCRETTRSERSLHRTVASQSAHVATAAAQWAT